MGGITSDEYEMGLAKLVEQARRLGVQADMLAAKAGDDMSEDVAARVAYLDLDGPLPLTDALRVTLRAAREVE